MKKFICFFILILVVFLIVSCENDGQVLIIMEKDKFVSEWAAWNSQNLKNYEFILKYFDDSCSVGPVKITIRENEAPVVENQSQNEISLIEFRNITGQ